MCTRAVVKNIRRLIILISISIIVVDQGRREILNHFGHDRLLRSGSRPHIVIPDLAHPLVSAGRHPAPQSTYTDHQTQHMPALAQIRGFPQLYDLHFHVTRLVALL